MVGLSVVLLGLSLALWSGSEPGVAVDTDATSPVWEVQAESVTQVEVTTADGVIGLDRTDDGWRMTSPMDVPADGARVDAALADVTRVTKGVPVADATVDGSDYGLGSNPSARVKITRGDGTTTLLVLGRETPAGFRTYARGADGGIVAVSGRPMRQLAGAAEAWRDHAVWRFDPAAVRRVRIETQGAVLEVYGEARRWWTEGYTRASPDRVDDLVVGLLDLRFERFEQLDLDVVDRRVRVDFSGGEALLLELGEAQPDGRVLARVGGERGWLHDSELALLGQGPSDVGDPAAFGFQVDAADTVSVVWKGGAWEARRNGSVWEAAGEDPVAVSEEVALLAAASIAYEAGEAKSPPGETWATVVVKTGPDTATIVVGVEESGHRRAYDSAGGSPFLIPSADLRVISDRMGRSGGAQR